MENGLQRKVQKLTPEKIAENVCVDTSTVHRIVSKFDVTGDVKRHSTCNIIKPVRVTVVQLVLKKPDKN